MSVEQAKAFIEKAQSDEALRAKLKAIKTENKEEAVAAVVRIAADAGYSFDAQHYAAAANAHVEAQYAAGELSDEQLDQVAGGATADSIEGCRTSMECSG